MGFQIEITKSAKKQLERLPKRDQRRIRKKIDALPDNPKPQGAKKLKGVGELHRIRSGDYRIIYQILKNRLIILVLRIGNRKEVYERLKGN